MNTQPTFHSVYFAILLIPIGLLISIGCSSGDPAPTAVQKTEASGSGALTNAETSAEPETPDTAPLYSDDAFRDAALNGKMEVVRSALDSGTDVNAAGPDKRIALHLAAFNGHTPIVKLLLERGAKVNHLDKIGRSALMYASTEDNAPVVNLLLDADAEVNLADKDEGFSALMFAAAEGQADVVELLLAAGADTSMQDIDGENARVFAKQKNHQAVLKLLDKYEAKK
jgi:ankyrin repeat protein